MFQLRSPPVFAPLSAAGYLTQGVDLPVIEGSWPDVLQLPWAVGADARILQCHNTPVAMVVHAGLWPLQLLLGEAQLRGSALEALLTGQVSFVATEMERADLLYVLSTRIGPALAAQAQLLLDADEPLPPAWALALLDVLARGAEDRLKGPAAPTVYCRVLAWLRALHEAEEAFLNSLQRPQCRGAAGVRPCPRKLVLGFFRSNKRRMLDVTQWTAGDLAEDLEAGGPQQPTLRTALALELEKRPQASRLALLSAGAQALAFRVSASGHESLSLTALLQSVT